MARRPCRPKIPLKHRLPNASSVFVGREDEIAWLTSTLERAPVVLVRGPGGIGKTSLVLRTIASAFPDAVERTLYVPIRPGEAPDQVRLTLAHLLASLSNARDSVDIAGVRGDPEELTAIAIDSAEEGGFWIVIDDLSHTDRDEMHELLRQLSAYARSSRWIATTRVQGELLGLEGQILDMERMGASALAELARELSPGQKAGQVQAAVSAAAGSPWLLHQYLVAGAEGLSLTRKGVLGSSSPATRELLHTLTILETPLSRKLLGRIVTLPPDDELDALSARGLIIDSSAGLKVHDQVADFLFPSSADDDGRRATLAAALTELDDHDATLEALRLHGQAGRIDSVVTLLDDKGHELIGLGFAPRLWSLVGDMTDRRVGLWQLRCAAELGNATVLAAVRAPRLTSHEDQLAWAATQYLIGEREEARRIALTVREESKDPVLRGEAALLSARCLLYLGRTGAAAEELSELADAAFAFAALGALVDACLERDGARSRTAALLGDANRDHDPEALLDLATAFYRTGERERADELVDSVLKTPRGGRASLLVARRALLLRARIRIDGGQLAAAEELLELVRPYARGTSILRPLLIELDSARRLAIGDLDGLDTAMERGIELARHADAGVTHRLMNLLDELGRRRGRAPTETGVSVPLEGSPWEPDDERRLRASLAAARVELTGGDVTTALDDARRVLREAAGLGLRLVEVEALLVVADGLLAGMFIEELAQIVNRLNELADALGSPRLRHHAAFYEGHGEIGVLERLANETDVAPIVARRARALLGPWDELDTLDEMVVAAARTAWADRSILTMGVARSGDWTPAWGLDATRSLVWLPDGRIVSFHKKPLMFRILMTLADRGGTATKEQLINEAWAESEYHPIRHDPKLHVSIRALRIAIEDDPSNPTRLMTTDDGYGLRGAIRRISTTPATG